MPCTFDYLDLTYALCEECGRVVKHTETSNVYDHLNTPHGLQEEPAPVVEPKQRNIFIDADKHGAGDLIVCAWIAEGSRGSMVQLFQHATGAKRTLLELLSQDVVISCPYLSDTYDAYTFELRNSSMPRIKARAEFLGVFTPPARPPCTLDDSYDDWAEKQCRNDTPLVCLFPMSAYDIRCWPVPYWIDLANCLAYQGYEVKTFLPVEDVRFGSLSGVYYNQDWRNMAALMLRSSLVVGNDSGPCHLAGTLDVPTLAIMGSSPAHIFSHLPSVRTIHGKLSCTGCYYNKEMGYRPACDFGCSSLLQLPMRDVADRALDILEGTELRTTN